MPTKKKRVGFIPRIVVLEIINKLSFENNLSNSKIINILVEEALSQRGILNIKKGDFEFDRYENNIINGKESILKNKDDNENRIFKENVELQSNKIPHDFVDSEIYNKFLMFLQFQEKMKNNNIL